MLPFLLLFLRKSDRLTWLSMIVAGLGLTFITTPPTEVVDRCRECLKNIERYSAPGGLNDYTYVNPSNAEILGVDHALYRLGVRDRSTIRIAQFAILGLLGLWLAWLVMKLDKDKPAAACALVAFFAAIFLYHRFYDLVILVLPLVYALGRSQRVHGLPRILYGTCVAAILAALYLRVGWLRNLAESIPEEPDIAWRLVEAAILPYGDWCLLIGMFSLAGAESNKRNTV